MNILFFFYVFAVVVLCILLLVGRDCRESGCYIESQWVQYIGGGDPCGGGSAQGETLGRRLLMP
jgi:hypothetical protein